MTTTTFPTHTCGICAAPATSTVQADDNWTAGSLCERHADHAARCGATVVKGTFTATRTRKGHKATVTVTGPGFGPIPLGGARADRAEAAIVTCEAHLPAPKVHGLRGDLATAQTEARRLATQTSMKRQGVVLNFPAALWAVAVPIEDWDLTDEEADPDPDRFTPIDFLPDNTQVR